MSSVASILPPMTIEIPREESTSRNLSELAWFVFCQWLGNYHWMKCIFLVLCVWLKLMATRRGSISMRAAVIVCEQPCVKGQLDYAFREDYESSSGGPALNPTWGEGTFDTSLGPYRFFLGQFCAPFCRGLLGCVSCILALATKQILQVWSWRRTWVGSKPLYARFSVYCHHWGNFVY